MNPTNLKGALHCLYLISLVEGYLVEFLSTSSRDRDRYVYERVPLFFILVHEDMGDATHILASVFTLLVLTDRTHQAVDYYMMGVIIPLVYFPFPSKC